MRKRTFLLVLGSLVLTVFIAGCSDNKSSSHRSVSVASKVYYDYLETGKHVELAATQPQFPASGELFLENASIFKLLPAKSTARSSSHAAVILSDFALYAPPSPTVKRVASTVSDTTPTTSGSLPGFKKNDIIPDGCSGLSGDTLRDCLDTLEVSSAPVSEHVSHHDSESLKIQAGAGIENSIVNKSVQSLASNISKTDRDAIISKLTDFSNDDSAHANVDISSFKPFDLAGYALNTVAISDNSSSDSNDDGVLERHSTMITEIIKPLNYGRSPSATLEACISKYKGTAINDRYVFKLTTYVHLNYLKPQRQVLPTTPDAPAGDVVDFEGSQSAYETVHSLLAIDQALDANIIKSIYTTDDVLPAAATEYTLMFQLAPDVLHGEYKDLLGDIIAANDPVCQDAVEQHMNPRTAIISGTSSVGSSQQKAADGSLTVFYQVPSVFSPQLSAKFASALLGESVPPANDVIPFRDYCMLDGNGQKVAIVDPASGAIIPACEKIDDKIVAKVVMFTKNGACKGEKGDWAYYPSRARTPRFGRGLQFILTEWLLHNQVGDYKNIHWYQSSWKSSFQVLVKGSKFVASTYFKIQFGAISVPKQEGAAAAIYIVNSFFPLLGDMTAKSTGLKIAGIAFSMPAYVVNFFLDMAYAEASNPTFGSKLAAGVKGALKGFLVDRLTDAVAQIIDVEVTGWQDISDDSHRGCFGFD